MGNTFSTVDVELVNSSGIDDVIVSIESSYRITRMSMEGVRSLPRSFKYITLDVRGLPEFCWSIPPEQITESASNYETLEQSTDRLQAIDYEVISIKSNDRSVRLELDRSNPALWRLVLQPIRIKIRLRNMSTKNITIEGSRPVIVVPDSHITVSTFTSITTNLGTRLDIRAYSKNRASRHTLTMRSIVDGLVFNFTDANGCVTVIVTDEKRAVAIQLSNTTTTHS